MTTNWPGGINCCLGKGLFSRSVTICPLTSIPAGHWRPLDGQVPTQVDERLPAQSWNLRAGFVGESLARQNSSAPRLLQVCPEPSSPGAAGNSALWCPSGPGAVEEGAWDWQESSWGMPGAAGKDGDGARAAAGASRSAPGGSPVLRADLQERGAKGFALQRGWIFGTVQGTTDFGVVLLWIFLHKGVL